MNKDLKKLFQQAKTASQLLPECSVANINAVIKDLARLFWQERQMILRANQKDLLALDRDDPGYDRAQLTEKRLADLCRQLNMVARLPSPLGKVLGRKKLQNGLKLSRLTVPLGVIGIIYESRPNVTAEVFALCLKSGNACVLKGGKEVEKTNRVLVDLMKQVLRKYRLPVAAVCLLPSTRDSVRAMLTATAYLDVLIPRGGAGLIQFVRENATVPVIETGAGVVHAYFDTSGDASMGASIVTNAKTRRVSVCNALDTLIIHRSRLKDLPVLVGLLESFGVEIYADAAAHRELRDVYAAKLLFRAESTDFGREFLSLKLSIKTVSHFEQAISHINRFGSKHSETIIATDPAAIEAFFRQVDAAVLYSNASTSFTDGGQFSLGAEIGISTQKLHARGPLGLEALTTYKWIVCGTGQVRK